MLVRSIEYASNPVDTHEISGWPGQTLTRGTGAEGDTLVEPEEATVYTNIVPSTPRKRTYGGDSDENTSGDVPAPTAASPIELDAGQGDDASLNEVVADTTRSFTATIDGISGTFTCAAGVTGCTEVMTATNSGSQRFLNRSA